MTVVALLGLLAAWSGPVAQEMAVGPTSAPSPAADGALANVTAARGGDHAAQERAGDPVGAVLRRAADADDGGPSALEFEESEEELHALVAAACRYAPPTIAANPSRRSSPRPAMADWHVVAPSRAPPA